jgi:signal peptidase I
MQASMSQTQSAKQMPAFVGRVFSDIHLRRRLGQVAADIATLIVIMAIVVVLILGLGPIVLPFQDAAVLSGSMAPTIQTGSLVILQPVAPDQLRVGDVITFNPPSRPDLLITHRIIAIENTSQGPEFTTRGDANVAADPWRLLLPKGWRVIYTIPVLGYLVSYAQTGFARFLLLALPGFGLFVVSLRTMLSVTRKPNSKAR